MNKHKPFREHHLLQALASYDAKQGALDQSLYRYFRGHRALGAKDRKFIADHIYGMMRWKGTLDKLFPDASWEHKFTFYCENDFPFTSEKLSLHEQLSLPCFLYEELVLQYGPSEAAALALVFNEAAPTFLRVNRLKITREELLSRFSGRIPAFLCDESPDGIRLAQRTGLFSLPEFREGLFEMQDEGSQCLARLVQAKPGDQVLDYCSGSGGKTLAFAPAMQGRGQIYLHDIRLVILEEARRRLRRAGIENAQTLSPEKIQQKRWKQAMDWVLVDAPCSGTGTLRRNPDMKWKLTQEQIQNLVSEQRTIFERALRFVRPGGKIVYATCSILAKENQEQSAHFLRTYPLTLCHEWSSLPRSGEMDGFYGVVFRKA